MKKVVGFSLSGMILVALGACDLSPCGSGQEPCGNGCMPQGNTCCGSDNCPAGDSCGAVAGTCVSAGPTGCLAIGEETCFYPNGTVAGCAPLGASCCLDGTYCPVGTVCLNGGTSCGQ